MEEILRKANDSLKVYERYNNFIDYKADSDSTNENGSKLQFMMDGYLDENGNAKAAERVYAGDLNGDGHEEFLIIISTAPYQAEIIPENDFLVYINDNGEAVPVMQGCCVSVWYVIDYGDFKFIPVTEGFNNSSKKMHILSFDGTTYTEKLSEDDALPVYDESTGKIYSYAQWLPSKYYILNSKTREYEEYEITFDTMDEHMAAFEDFDEEHYIFTPF